jgi:SSS family solute:Na+ symporter
MVTATTALALTAVVLAVFAGLGAWYSRGRIDNVEDFITARDSASQGTLTATLIASGMGAWILFSPAEAGAGLGITAALGYGLGSSAPMVLYVAVGPRIRRLIPEGHTLTEYAYARYGSLMYAYVLLVSISYMFIFLAADLTAIANALEFIAGVPKWQTSVLITTLVVAYTTYGGLQASIFTDTVQALVVLPLLVVTFGGAVFLLGGPTTIHDEMVRTNAALLNPGFVPGLKLGVALVLAILGAEMLNQAWWQRIYAAESERTLRRSFAVTAIAVVPIVFVGALGGAIASGLGLVGDNAASNAYILLLAEAFPSWIPLAVTLLVTVLVMSTVDTLFNALSSIVTADLPRLLDDPDRETLTWAARGLTVFAGVGAVYVSIFATSVLSLFLLADLLATATFIPLLYGLYSGRLSERSAVAASASALVVGVLLFPMTADVLGSVPLLETVVAPLPSPSTFNAFVSATVVSAAATALAAAVSSAGFDLDRLATDVRRLDDPEAATDGGRDPTGSAGGAEERSD